MLTCSHCSVSKEMRLIPSADTEIPWSGSRERLAETIAHASVPGDRRGCLATSKADTVVQAIGEAWLQLTSLSQEAEGNAWLQPKPIHKELLAVSNASIMLTIELPTATPPLAKATAYAQADVTIRIRSNRYYLAEYRIAIHPTIRP